jgi:hypothetical protein
MDHTDTGRSGFAAIANDLAHTAIHHADILARCTVHPWVVSLVYRLNGATEFRTLIVRAPLAEAPQAHDHLPADAELLRADIFLADRFEDMPQSVRPRYTGQYRHFLMWRRAWALRKELSELEPWVDYDAIDVDNRVQRWVRGRQEV